MFVLWRSGEWCDADGKCGYAAVYLMKCEVVFLRTVQQRSGDVVMLGSAH